MPLNTVVVIIFIVGFVLLLCNIYISQVEEERKNHDGKTVTSSASDDNGNGNDGINDDLTDEYDLHAEDMRAACRPDDDKNEEETDDHKIHDISQHVEEHQDEMVEPSSTPQPEDRTPT